MKTHYRVGTRGSLLAVTQTQQTVDALAALNPGVSFELVRIKTTGDKITDVPLARIGDKGLFVKEIEQALLDGEVDLAIHSMKDMPTDLPPGLVIGCVPKRCPPFDCLITREPGTLDTLPPGSVVGSGSLRRRAQLATARPDLQFVELRGNLPTRLAKLSGGTMAATLLAAAGLMRLGSLPADVAAGQTVEIPSEGTHYHGWIVPPEVCVPAVGQGALCIERRADDAQTASLLDKFNDPASFDAVRAERRFLGVLQGGCQIPAGAVATVEGDTLRLTTVLCSLDGREVYRHPMVGPRSEAEKLGEAAAQHLLGQGAAELLTAIRQG